MPQRARQSSLVARWPCWLRGQPLRISSDLANEPSQMPPWNNIMPTVTAQLSQSPAHGQPQRVLSWVHANSKLAMRRATGTSGHGGQSAALSRNLAGGARKRPAAQSGPGRGGGTRTVLVHCPQCLDELRPVGCAEAGHVVVALERDLPGVPEHAPALIVVRGQGQDPAELLWAQDPAVQCGALAGQRVRAEEGAGPG